MNDITQLITVLFLMSSINERIAEFFKNYLSGKKIGSWYIVGDVTTKFPVNSREELRRGYRILKINLIIGFTTALLCHASFLDLIHNIKNPSNVLFWPEKFNYAFDIKYLFANILFLIGCLFTGAFISLGSKFWHDLLDILLQVKNAKRTITDQQTDISTLTTEKQFPLVKQAIIDNKDSWKNTIKNYQGVTIGKKLKGGNGEIVNNSLCIQFNVERKEDISPAALKSVPQFVYFNGYKIPTDVIETGVIKAGVFSGDNIARPKPPGCSIGREGIEFAGTLGIRMKLADGGLYALSCYHVVFSEEMKAGTYEIKKNESGKIKNSPTVISPSLLDGNTLQNIGSASHGVVNKYIDCGFFKTSIQDVQKTIYQLGVPNDIYDLESGDEKVLNVKFCGRTSGLVTQGVVFAVSTYPTITYFSDTDKSVNIDFEDLIQLKIDAQEGDSGSIVLTEDNYIVGMIVAVAQGYAYAISMRSIYNNFPFQLA